MATKAGAPSIPQGGSGDVAMPHIDFTAVPDVSPVPAGRYNATIVSAVPGRSKTGNAKIDVRWKVDDGEFAGRQVFDSISFHENALWRAKQTLRAINGDVFDKAFSGAVDVNDLITESAIIQVIIDQQEDIDPNTGDPYEPRNKVVKVFPYGSQVTMETLPV